MTITPIHSEGAGAANNRPGDGSMTDTVEQCDREAAALASAIIDRYHTTRTTEDPVAHILNGRAVRNAFDRLRLAALSSQAEEIERLREALESIAFNDQVPRHKVYRVPVSEETVDGRFARIARQALESRHDSGGGVE